MFVLNDLELAHDMVSALLEPWVASREVHEAGGGQIMAGNVAGQVPASAIPSGVRFSFLRKAGADAVVREHPVWLELQQVFRGDVLRTFERTA